MAPTQPPTQPPIEPPASAWDFPSGDAMDFFAPDEDCLGEGADLEPGTLLEAYRHGIFPMPLSRRAAAAGRTAWWSPVARGVLPLDGLRITRSLRKSRKRFEVTVDAAFDEVIMACADPTRYGSWISDDIIAAYRRLHQLGWVHSIEAWSADGTLAGGLYGVSINGLFAGESMFHRETDASKVALVGLVELLTADGKGDQRLLDVQWVTPHLASLGAIELSRREYLARLAQALRGSAPDFGQKMSSPTSMVSSSSPDSSTDASADEAADAPGAAGGVDADGVDAEGVDIAGAADAGAAGSGDADAGAAGAGDADGATGGVDGAATGDPAGGAAGGSAGAVAEEATEGAVEEAGGTNGARGSDRPG